MSSLSLSTCNVCGSGQASQAGQQVATLTASQTSQKISSWEAIKFWRMPVVSASGMVHIEQLCVCFWSKDGGLWFPPWPAPPRRLPAAPRRPESWAPGTIWTTSITWNLIINLIFLDVCTTQRKIFTYVDQSLEHLEQHDQQHAQHGIWSSSWFSYSTKKDFYLGKGSIEKIDFF